MAIFIQKRAEGEGVGNLPLKGYKIQLACLKDVEASNFIIKFSEKSRVEKERWIKEHYGNGDFNICWLGGRNNAGNLFNGVIS